jgi:hypothetical protein
VGGKLSVAGMAGTKVLSEPGIKMASDSSSGFMLFTAKQGSFSNRAVGGKLSMAGMAGTKVLSELGVQAGIIMASDGSSRVVHGKAGFVHSIDRTHSRHPKSRLRAGSGRVASGRACRLANADGASRRPFWPERLWPSCAHNGRERALHDRSSAPAGSPRRLPAATVPAIERLPARQTAQSGRMPSLPGVR